MKISAIELYPVSVPLGEAFWPAWIPGYPQTHNRFTLIKIIEELLTLRQRGFRSAKMRVKNAALKKSLKAALDLKKRKEAQAS